MVRSILVTAGGHQERNAMTESICQPLKETNVVPLKRRGLALTDFRGTRATLFEKIKNPDSYLARLRPAGGAYDNWRDSMPLDPEIQACTMGWPITVDLQSAYLLDEAGGIPSWEVERAIEGLSAGEPNYIELASGLLVDAEGCLMQMPGGVNAVLVRADVFKACVVIDEPVLLLGAMNI
jgi:hypothetical protein